MIRIASLAACLSLLVAAPAFAQIVDPVRTASGLIAGTTGSEKGVRVFKGIPFAAPPVGRLRWRDPQPPAPWQGVRSATEFGPRCMQGQDANPTTSEDCLYLNVWTAAPSAAERRPVIVWSYGGSLRSGAGSQPQYDGEALARKGAVFVTYNYRLGPFGFFSHPELTSESPYKASGNYGLMDLIVALEWVRANISSFGGDPNRVTIMGESAGASLVACLVTSPRAKGLFHRAIAQSTGCTGTSRIGTPLTTLAEAEREGQKLAAAMGASSLAGLRAMSADDILRRGQGARVIVDGYTITEDWLPALARGAHNGVDLLLGSNKDEGTFPIFGVPEGTAQEFVTRTKQRFGDLTPRFLALYPAGSESESATSQLNAFRDLVFWNLHSWARLQTARGTARAYLYFFTREPPVAPGQPSRGASHTAEIPYAFNNLHIERNQRWTDTDRRLAEMMSSYWINFAATGDPNGPGLPVWPRFSSADDRSVMILGERVEAGPAPDRRVRAIYDRHYGVDKLLGAPAQPSTR
jgi:para-nitrobenzyl esterase